MFETLKVYLAKVARCEEPPHRYGPGVYNILVRFGSNRTRSIDMTAEKQALKNLSLAVGSPKDYGLIENWLVRVVVDPSTDRIVAIGHIVKDKWYIGAFNDQKELCTLEELQDALPSFVLTGDTELVVVMRKEPKVVFRFDENGIARERTLELELEGSFQKFTVRLTNMNFLDEILGHLCLCADVTDTSKLKDKIFRIKRCSEGDPGIAHVLTGHWYGIGNIVKTDGEAPNSRAVRDAAAKRAKESLKAKHGHALARAIQAADCADIAKVFGEGIQAGLTPAELVSDANVFLYQSPLQVRVEDQSEGTWLLTVFDKAGTRTLEVPV